MPELRRSSKHHDVPHVPFYKDEKVLGRSITTGSSLRLMIASFVITVVAFGWALFAVIKNSNDLHDYVDRAHAARVRDQAQMTKDVDQLACYLVAAVKDNPKQPIIAKFRAQYHCPPYGKDPNFRLYSPSPKPPAPTKAPASRKPLAAGGSGGGAGTSRSLSRPRSSGSQAQAAGPRLTPSTPTSSPTPAPVTAPTSTANQPVVHIPVTVPSLVAVPSLIAVGGTCTVHVGTVCVVR